MTILVVVQVVRKSRGFGVEFAYTLVIALMPSLILAFARADKRTVTLFGILHVVLMVSLATLYLIGTGPLGLVYAFLIYIAALVTSIIAVCINIK